MRAAAIMLALGGWCAVAAHAAEADATAEAVEAGRRIYQEGRLPSGEPLQATRAGGTTVSGFAAACASCHRRSGMGSVEGDIEVPPITGNALFGGDQVIATMDPRSGKAWNRKHDPYDDGMLAQAVRSGMDNSGRTLSAAMPRYALNDGEMAALTAYLRQLSRSWSPGVTATTIHFATVVTPDVAPERKQVMLDMMRAIFAQKNGSTVSGRQAGGRRHMVSGAEMVLGTERNWKLDVWELQGEPQTWAAQLAEFYRRQPVFALVSGLSGGEWRPVHEFCEREQVPCWFPSVDLPAAQADAFYAMYFSRGVLLEAAVLARHLADQDKQRAKRVVQVYRDEPAARAAAQGLEQSLAGSGIAVEARVLDDASPQGLRRALHGIRKQDAVMFWLRPDDLALLGKVAPPAGKIYFSARLAEDRRAAFPAQWKSVARLVYPYELPERRDVNLAYLHQWLKLRNIALVDEPLQAEVFFSLAYLTDTVAEMLDNLYRDYLLERAESMISRRETGKAEAEAWARDTLRQPARLAAVQSWGGQDMRRAGEGTTVYPRLSLGPTQRFASKGGYIARFGGGDGLLAESGWIVP